ncbi:hypothetical protein [Cytobacillus horneckiae]|uniref:Uncharacterized protein n=1 Tax=Cytobacillus horneckiae TaxID=549687 RepID=A0A2N0ZJ68_9BACI|nr:hypothetical protein [Cytobacillus horneckiae]MEC1156465.1 hypothetical protein [Cytobacillus horneckiae]MED2938482.1 hypothetical protein [Cytobacillus horneckiae]PKG29543.1 hypothetical protein CWS20_07950 [Cytobacillus horneckiae]
MVENEDDFLYDIGYEDNSIDEFYGQNQIDYIPETNGQVVQPMFAPVLGLILRTVIVNDKNGKKVSIHYFQSKSGLVYDVKVKSGWSVK